MEEPHSMPCWVYRGTKKAETYVYLREKDNFALVPRPLRAAMGRLELVLELTLNPALKLARADPRVVMSDLERQGYHLQMPPAATGPYSSLLPRRR